MPVILLGALGGMAAAGILGMFVGATLLALGYQIFMGWVAADQDRLTGCFLLGGERTLLQDPGFGLRQIVDIACRALSPAINDPTTAVQAIDRLTSLIATLAQRPDPSGFYLGEGDVVRVAAREPSFSRLARLAYTEISLFAAHSPQVSRRLLAAYTVLEGLTEGPRRAAIVDLRRRTLAAVDAQMPPAFLDIAREADRLGFG